MSRLRVFSDDNPGTVLASTSDHAEMARRLNEIDVPFEQWQASAPIAPGATPEEVMAAYRSDIDRLVAENGFKTVDVVSIAPDNPNREAMRAKFLAEHYHEEDEIRFFVIMLGEKQGLRNHL